MARRKNIIFEQEDSDVGGKIEPASTYDLDFNTALELFIKEQKIRNRAARTIEWYRENLHTLRVFLERQGLPTNPNLITTKVLKENYVLHMLETLKLSPVTVNGRIRTVKSFFAFLKSENYLTRNPDSLMLIKTRKTVIQAFTNDQVKLLLGVPDKNSFTGLRDYTIMLLLLETGMRVSELVNLKLKDIRWADGKILVLGKGDKERLLPYQRQMKNAFRRYLSIRGDIEGEDHLFLTIDNTPMTKRNIQERIQYYGITANLKDVRVSPHTFRHTFAKMYIKNGGDAFSLQAILGHSTLEMVRHYVNLFSSDVQEQHRKFSPLEHMKL